MPLTLDRVHQRCGWVRSVTLLSAVVAASTILLLPEAARAQASGARRTTERSASGGKYVPGPADIAPVTNQSPTKADEEPYTRWKVHTGFAEQAVAFVRMELTDAETGQKQIRTGTGLVIRCDGFVLVPPTLVAMRIRHEDGTFGQAHINTKKLTLTFAAGDPEEEDSATEKTTATGTQRVPKAQDVFQPRYFEEYRDFTALKANDIHLRGLQMLHPKNIRPGATVHLVWAVPDPKRPGVAKAMIAQAKVGEEFVPNKIKLHFQFAPGADGALPRVPMGTVVVDPQSGLALGMVTGTDFMPPKADPEGRGFVDEVLSAAGKTMPPDPAGPYATAYSFATFQSVYDTQNAVAVLPDPSARDSGGRSSGEPTEINNAVSKAIDGMVYIPGGPVELYDWFRGWLRHDYYMLYDEVVACTPGFWIDRREVTRQEYRDFLKATGYRPLPAGWAANMLQDDAPLRGGDLPVVGVRPEDAAAYALWRGKRLVTPVEWAKAARLATLEFVEGQQQSLLETNAHLKDIDGREQQAIKLKIEELRAKGYRVDGNTRFQLGIQSELDDERRNVVGDFLDRSGFLVQGTVAGGTTGDVSIYGVRDINTNCPEWLLQNLGKQGRDVNSKPLMIPWKPPLYLADGSLNPVARAIGGSLTDGRWVGSSRPPSIMDRQALSKTGFGHWELLGEVPMNPMMTSNWGELSQLIGRDPDFDLKFYGVTGMGFRCAR